MHPCCRFWAVAPLPACCTRGLTALASAGALEEHWTCTNAKKPKPADDGSLAVDYTAAGRLALTYPPHAWAAEFCARACAIDKRTLGKDSKALVAKLPADDGPDTLDEQAIAIGVAWPSLYKLVQADAFGCPIEQLLAALAADDAAAAVNNLFNKEYNAFTALARAHDLRCNQVTMLRVDRLMLSHCVAVAISTRCTPAPSARHCA